MVLVCVLVQLSLFFIYFFGMQGELVRLFANDQNKIRCGNVLFNRSRHSFVVVIAENVFLLL